MSQLAPASPRIADATLFDSLTDDVAAGTDATAAARYLYEQLTDTERLAILHGDTAFWPGRLGIMEHGYNHRPYSMCAVPRLGIPGARFIDGPRGVVVGHGTAFPVPMARGASWDTALEEEIGQAIGLEVRASGGNFFGGVCINLPRHPAWGRSQETYSDQPLLLGEFGAALVRGVKDNAMPCVKHFALNSMENARFDVDVRCDEATMHEDFLPHFKTAIDAGAASVMCAYNSINGDWASQNRELLTTVLREDWGFDGFVISDFIWAIRDGVASLRAGLDVEAPFAQLRAEQLPGAIGAGLADWADVERSAIRILATQLEFFAQRNAAEPAPAVIASAEHRALARRAAQRSMVLLRNQVVDQAPILPLAAASLDRLAVVGRLADLPSTGDHGSSNVHAEAVVTPLSGLRAALPEGAVVHDDGADVAAAAALAATADAAVVVVGYTAAEEGEWVNGRVYVRDDLMALYPEPRTAAEKAVQQTMLDRAARSAGQPELGGDRSDLRLPAADIALIEAVSAANPRTVVVVVSAGAVLLGDWHDRVPGLVMAWYAGMEGGHALADLLLGKESFCGHLPYALPASVDDLPFFDATATQISYDRWYGQRLIAHRGSKALYPLGFGLSYTNFELSEAVVAAQRPEQVELTVTARNTGERAGRCVVQIYGTRLSGERAGERELLGFAVADLDAGAGARVPVTASLQPLSTWNPTTRTLRAEPGAVRLEIAQYWGDPQASQVIIHL